MNQFKVFHLSTNPAVFMVLVQHGYYTFMTKLDFHRAALSGLIITITICDPFKKAVVIYEVLIDRAPLTIFLGNCKSKHALKKSNLIM